MLNIPLYLDSERDNYFPEAYKFKQGNLNRTFVIYPTDNGVKRVIADTDKIELYFAYLDRKGFIINNSPMVDENSADYSTIVDLDETENTVTVNACYQMVDHAGDIRFTLKINELYMYEVTYSVDATDNYTNKTFSNTMPIWSTKANADLSNVPTSAFLTKAAASNVATASDLNANIKFFTDPTNAEASRLSYDNVAKVWRFERLVNGQWIEKLKIGESIIVDVVKLIAGEKPTNIPSNELAIYNKAQMVNGQQSLRPHFVLPDGNEYTLVVHDVATDKVVFRANDGTLKEIPIDSIETGESIKNKLESLQLDDRLSATAIKNLNSEVNISSVLSNNNNFEGQNLNNVGTIMTKPTIEDYWKLNTDDAGMFRVVNQDDDIIFTVDQTGRLITPTFNSENLNVEVERLKTDISTNVLETYVWRGKGVPTVDISKAYKDYYIHSIVLSDDNGIIDIPAIAPNDSIFSVENNDISNFLTLQAPIGETINGQSTPYKCDFNTFNFFVKDGTNWILAYGGVFPNNLSDLQSTISGFFPNSLHNIDEVKAQLKDRLHTFREVQNEFVNQLRIEDDIKINFSESTSVEIPYSRDYITSVKVMRIDSDFEETNISAMCSIKERYTKDSYGNIITKKVVVDFGTTPVTGYVIIV